MLVIFLGKLYESFSQMRKFIRVARKWRQMKTHFEKTSGHDSKTEDQKRIKQNCFHRGYVRRCVLF